MLNKFLTLVVFFLIVFPLFHKVYAVTYDLIAPEGQLHRGQEVQFTIYIDTEGTTVTTGQIGVTYETQYLEYLGITAGPAMTSVTAAPQETGSFLITGTNASGFSGNDIFANLNFKIIADAPGSTELCALFIPTPSPTTPPGTTPNPTSPPNPTNPPTNPTSSPGTTTAPTSPPAPGSKGGTNPPASGNNSQAAIALSLGFALVMVYGVLRFFRKIKA
ncbi:MAG: hypothetical protein HYT11_04830 [Candidatus Levybacteria bacterium]|nr:hypothetical protein [Candidatus Levybacteria bacterium]